MNIESDIERAFTIYLAFGPDRAIPVRVRWREAFPGVADDVFEEWETQFCEIEHAAFGIGEKVASGDIDSFEAAAMMSNKYPRLGAERIARLVSRAVYYALK